jgi:hypothetical protein
LREAALFAWARKRDGLGRAAAESSHDDAELVAKVPVVLPAMTEDGRLPEGRHEATLDEIRERFVEEAPNRARRDLIFRALLVYADIVRSLFPEARLWINGGFVTHKSEAPKDVDVVIVSEAPDTVTIEQVAPLLTLQGVASEQPRLGIERLQPVGGLVDGFFANASMSDLLDYWDGQWSRVNGAPDTERKGYVEVRL